MTTKRGTHFSCYVFMDDKQKVVMFSKIDSDTFVKFGKYEMRERDRDRLATIYTVSY